MSPYLSTDVPPGDARLLIGSPECPECPECPEGRGSDSAAQQVANRSREKLDPDPRSWVNPTGYPDHRPYSKRAMAGDVLALMRQLGYERFAVVGHDRGSYVAARLALDAPQAVTRLAVLDSVPIGEALARADGR